MEKQKIKMSDIARLANVSKATVSRALNDSPLISADTKAHIRQIAAEHNYSINIKARNFSMRTSQTIALITPVNEDIGQPVSDPFFLQLLASVGDNLSIHGYDLLISKSGPAMRDWEADFILSGKADGLIVFGQGPFRQNIQRVSEHNLPIVIWGEPLANSPYCTVGSDNVGGAHQAVSHLLKLGRKRIAFLGDTAHPEVAARYWGYQLALKENGIELDERLLVKAHFPMDSISDAVKHGLVEKEIQFDAIFAISDVIAMGAIKALHDAGVNVPRDVSVIGFDDTSVASYYSPSLTTVRQDTELGGKLLVEKLLQIIAGEKADCANLPAKLVVRNSCGGTPDEKNN